MPTWTARTSRSEEHTSELQSPCNLVCRLLLEKKKKTKNTCNHKMRRQHHHRHESRHHCIPHRYLVCRIVSLLPSSRPLVTSFVFFFFNDTATTEIYTLSLHDALPIYFLAAFSIGALRRPPNAPPFS